MEAKRFGDSMITKNVNRSLVTKEYNIEEQLDWFILLQRKHMHLKKAKSNGFSFFIVKIISLPLISLLSIIWLYVQGEQTGTLSKFALGVLWGFPATAVLLVIVYIMLQHSIHLFISIGLGLFGWFVFLFVQEIVFKSLKSLFIG